jgi:uncharacterized short protein YbdD (DUF466 family)
MERAGRLAHQIRRHWVTYWATLMGDNHYRRYLEFRARVHPGEPVLSEREYWRMRHASTEANPNARCC